MPIRVRLKKILEKEGVSVYKLAQYTKGYLSRQSLYGITSESDPPKRIEFLSLAAILAGLKEATGKNFGVGDILEYQTDEEYAAEERKEDKKDLEALIAEHGKEWVLKQLDAEE